MRCGKGEIDRNLRRHVESLEAAEAHGCDLAVFPEFSLTGSVDPLTTPEHLVSVKSQQVEGVVAATGRTGVAAVFGIGERQSGSEGTLAGPFITQLYACDGELAGIQRKRHLGDDEVGFETDDDDASFVLDRTSFAIAICAEGGVDRPWLAAASAGVDVVLFCSAPGLYGRRTDEASWRDGNQWWLECGLGDARRQAAHHRLWVAMATQAGSTTDEDFPGLAALVDPSGEVVAQLAGWRPGTLVVDVPVPPDPKDRQVSRGGPSGSGR
jgi:predicted amidohydrolase